MCGADLGPAVAEDRWDSSRTAGVRSGRWGRTTTAQENWCVATSGVAEVVSVKHIKFRFRSVQKEKEAM